MAEVSNVSAERAESQKTEQPSGGKKTVTWHPRGTGELTEQELRQVSRLDLKMSTAALASYARKAPPVPEKSPLPLQALDLGVLASRIQDCVIEEFSNWNLEVPVYGARIPVEKPLRTWADRKVEASYGNEMTCEAAEALIKTKGFLEQFKPFDYDGFPTICDFIGHAQEYLKSHLQENAQNHPKLSPEELFRRTVAEAFRTFRPDSSTAAEKNRRGTCASVSREGKERLEKIGLRSQFVIAKGMRTTDPPQHAALVVPCNDGIIILELLGAELFVLKPRAPEIQPGEGIGEPTTYESLLSEPKEISLLPGDDGISQKGTIRAHFKIVETNDPYQIKNLVIVRELIISDQTGRVVDNLQTQYLLRSKFNPDHPVMEHYTLDERKYTKLEHTGGGKTPQLTPPGKPSTSAEEPVPEESSKEVATPAHKTGKTIGVEVFFDNGLIAVGQKEKGKELQRIEIPVSVFNPETKMIDLSREPEEKKREELRKEIRGFIGEGKIIETLGGFWEMFRSPEVVKDQVFLLASQESVKIMQALYAGVRDKKLSKSNNLPVT